MEWAEINKLIAFAIGVFGILGTFWKIIMRPNMDKTYMKRNECEFKEREQGHVMKEFSHAITRLDKTISKLETHVELIINGKIKRDD